MLFLTVSIVKSPSFNSFWLLRFPYNILQAAQGGGHRTLLYGHAILLRHSFSGMVSSSLIPTNQVPACHSWNGKMKTGTCMLLTR